MSKNSHKTQIIIAIIGLVGVLAAAVIGNWREIFSGDKTEIRKPKCAGEWVWDRTRQSCIIRVVIQPRLYSIPLNRTITRVSGRMDFYLNTRRLKGNNSQGYARYSKRSGVVQIVIPIMVGNTTVGDFRDVIYSTRKGKICSVSKLTAATGHLKRMRVK